ncbi:MAG TPA: VWA domain-containing protein [Vicinamibacteria bacterium]
MRPLLPGAAGQVARRALALGLAALGPASLLAQPPIPTFSGGVEAVYVDAFVTHEGRPVLGLGADSFELKDQGKTQKLELVGVEDLPLTVFLVFDASGSVEGTRLANLRSASEAFLAGLRPQDEIGLVSFSHELRLLAPPSTDRDVLRSALRSMRAEGGTAFWDALHAGLTLLPGRTRGLVVAFSDGEDNLSVLEEKQVQEEARRSNAVVHVVGVAVPAGPQRRLEPEHVRALRQAAEVTGGRYWTSDSPHRLTESFAAIAAAMNTRYVLRFEPSDPGASGWHRLDLRLRTAKGEVRARQGYFRTAR